MKGRIRVITALLLGASTLLATAQTFAQPHETPSWKDPDGPPTAMDVWLKRLVGRYQFEGLVEVVALGGCVPPDAGDGTAPPPSDYCKAIKGMGDCVAIGTGPGVQCVLGVTWPDMYQVDHQSGATYNIPGGASYLAPAMLLFGLDQGRSGINYLLVDNKGLPEGGLGSNNGNRATFKTPCVNAPALFLAMPPNTRARNCDRTIRFDAKPDSAVVHMSMDIEIGDGADSMMFTRYEMTLRRVSPSVAIAR